MAEKRGGGGKSIIWMALIVFVGLVAYVLGGGGQIVKLSGPGGLGVEFLRQPPDEQSRKALESQQKKLQDELEVLKKQVKASQDAPPPGPKPPTPTFSGRWTDQMGFVYTISQAGNGFTITQINPLYGLMTMVGEGIVHDNQLQFGWRAADGSLGEAYLALSPDGLGLSGTVSNAMTGMTVPAMLYRQQ